MSHHNGSGRGKRKSEARTAKMRLDRSKEAERVGVRWVEGSPPKMWMNTGQEMGQMQKGGSKQGGGGREKRQRWGYSDSSSE